MKHANRKSFLARLPRGIFLGFYVVWAIALYVLSSQPGNANDAPPFPHFDKVLHFGYFFGGACLLSFFALKSSKAPSRAFFALMLVMLLGLVVGRLDEFHQSFVPLRSGNDINDFLADSLGTLTGICVARSLFLALVCDEKRP